MPLLLSISTYPYYWRKRQLRVIYMPLYAILGMKKNIGTLHSNLHILGKNTLKENIFLPCSPNVKKHFRVQLAPKLVISDCQPLVCLFVCVCVCVCVCVRVRGGGGRFYQVFTVGPVWPHWRPRVGSLPIIAGLRCRPGVHPCIAPQPVLYALRPEPGSLPQDHPGSGVVAPWLPPGQLHGNSSTSLSSPCCPVCCVCIGVFTAGGARGSEAASTAYSIWRFPQKRCP